MNRRRGRETITFAWPQDAALWDRGDIVRTGGVERIVTWTGAACIELAPATWWRRAWFAVRGWVMRRWRAVADLHPPRGGKVEK